jgi:hypothetical protein
LDNYLYQQVKVSGVAAWDCATLAVSEIAIAAVLPRQRVAAATAFGMLRGRFGSHFDQIDDPNDWAAQAQ